METPKQTKKAVVIVGAGFSKALTSGPKPLLGHECLPTLGQLTETLLAHMQRLAEDGSRVPFSAAIIRDGILALQRNLERPEPHRYNFEELISLLSISSTLSRISESSIIPSLPGANPETIRCLLYCLADLLASRLSYNRLTKVNRNFFYQVNDLARTKAMKQGIWDLVDSTETTFVSFNYDGIVEAFLDHWLGEDRGYRYFVELSHALPLCMPEHVYSRRDGRDFSRIPRVPFVLKPHGSIHFFPIERGIARFDDRTNHGRCAPTIGYRF